MDRYTQMTRSMPDESGERTEATDSVVQRIRTAGGLARLWYIVHLIVGIVFFGLAIITALGLVGTLIGENPVTLWGATLVAYLALNLIVGYGFLFSRRWLIVILSSNFALMGLMLAASYATYGAQQLLPGAIAFAIIGVLTSFLALTQATLVGTAWQWRVLIPAWVLLLFAFAAQATPLLQ